MSEFNKDDYLNDLPDADDLAGAPDASAPAGSADESIANSAETSREQSGGASESANTASDNSVPTGDDAAGNAAEGDTAENTVADSDTAQNNTEGDNEQSDDDSFTPLGKAKKEAADYLEALQRERAEFINYRNRAQKEQDRFRQHGITDVLTALLPALDDIDRIREHSEMDDSFQAVATKIDKAFEKFGVEKFGAKGEEFDPTKHEAILHKPDSEVDKEIVDTVVEAGYRIGDRVIRAARVVVASPQN